MKRDMVEEQMNQINAKTIYQIMINIKRQKVGCNNSDLIFIANLDWVAMSDLGQEVKFQVLTVHHVNMDSSIPSRRKHSASLHMQMD